MAVSFPISTLRILVLLFVLVLAACQPSANTDTPTNGDAVSSSDASADGVAFSNDRFRFSVDNPVGWEQSEFPGVLVVFLSPLEGAEDTFRQNVNVVVEEGVSGYSAEEYSEAAGENMRKLMTAFQELATGTMTIDGEEVPTRDYSFAQGEYTLRGRQAYVVKDDLAYVLTYTALTGDEDKYAAEGEQIMATFKTL